MLLGLARAPAPAMQMAHVLFGFEPGRAENAPTWIVLAHAAPLAQTDAERFRKSQGADGVTANGFFFDFTVCIP
ncbi:hypothetical protein Y032_0006g3038 [Ancylostoma ceylanicum]|nr:hypothetical protein Y032_0006g3038 [Ancylostoma ceylanicum]